MTDTSSGGFPLWLGVALVFMGMMGRDMFTGQQETEETSTKKIISDEPLAGNSILFQYCYS